MPLIDGMDGAGKMPKPAGALEGAAMLDTEKMREEGHAASSLWCGWACVKAADEIDRLKAELDGAILLHHDAVDHAVKLEAENGRLRDIVKQQAKTINGLLHRRGPTISG
jgi:hypothetical protein